VGRGLLAQNLSGCAIGWIAMGRSRLQLPRHSIRLMEERCNLCSPREPGQVRHPRPVSDPRIPGRIVPLEPRRSVLQ
jgi:hypothetical protein